MITDATAAPPPRRLQWRPDIEGLRAIAIVPVVLFHFDRHLLPGGFLGVDLFLVISGYLIARMLLTGSYVESRAGLFWFLQRRALRILPTLCVTVMLFSPLFAFLLLPGEHTQFLQTGALTLIGVSNIFLAKWRLNYYSPAAQLNPFLHTWSVSLEDQFYVTVSVALFVFVKIARTRRNLPALIAAATAASLAFGAWRGPTASPALFYALPGRFWEFLFGASAYLLDARLVDSSRRVPAGVRVLGLAVVMIGFAVISDVTASFWAYVVFCCGAAAALVGGDAPAGGRLQRWLSHRWLRFIGARSFAIYMVHYPLLNLLALYFDPSVRLFAAYVMVCGLIAAGVHRFVEQPYIDSYRSAPNGAARRMPSVPARLVWAAAAGTAVVAIVMLPRVSLARAIAPRLARDADVRLPSDGALQLTVIGDSHAQQLFPAFEQLAIADDVAIDETTGGACFVSEDLRYVAGGRAVTACEARIRGAIANVLAQAGRPRVLFIGMRSQVYLSPYVLARDGRPPEGVTDGLRVMTGSEAVEAYARSLARTVAKFRDAGVPVVFLAPLPEMRLPTFSCLYNPARDNCGVSRSDEMSYRSPLMTELVKLSDEYANFTVWDPFDLVCPGQRCANVTDEGIAFRDDNHLSNEMVRRLAPSLRAIIEHVAHVKPRPAAHVLPT